jgi:hypothetical protein
MSTCFIYASQQQQSQNVADAHHIKKKKSKYTTTENHLITKEDCQKGRNYQKTINKMAVISPLL